MNNEIGSPSGPNEPKLAKPILLRMLHPTSGRERFNPVGVPPLSNQQRGFYDPRFAQAVSLQTQRAITATTMPYGTWGQSFGNPYALPYYHSIPQLYGYYQSR